MACIFITKGKRVILFQHQPVYNGAGSTVHCIFCQKQWKNKEEMEKEVRAENCIGEGI